MLMITEGVKGFSAVSLLVPDRIISFCLIRSWKFKEKSMYRLSKFSKRKVLEKKNKVHGLRISYLLFKKQLMAAFYFLNQLHFAINCILNSFLNSTQAFYRKKVMKNKYVIVELRKYVFRESLQYL